VKITDIFLPLNCSDSKKRSSSVIRFIPPGNALSKKRHIPDSRGITALPVS